ncbi:MAG: MATE family efflux transporter [Clostridia bacterium]|nr:MATE family efflux transporter [Clostridia bacterium]
MTANKRSGVKNLTEGPLLPQIIFFSLPLIATAVLQLLFNTADTIVVGRWGGSTPEECANSLAAVGSCGSLINLFVTFFLGFSTGAGICVAHDIGANRYEDLHKTVHTAVLTALISGAFVTAVAMTLCRQMLILMGTDAAILDEAVLYMQAYCIGMPANMLYNYCATILRSSGDTTRPLIFLSVAGVVNVLLNLLTVIVFGWGAMGVGIATAASQWVSCILIVIYMTRMQGPCRLEIRKIRMDIIKFRKMVLLGLPAGIQSTLFSLSNVMIQSAVNSFGPVVVAGNTAGSNLDSYIYATQNALYHTSLTFVGQHIGAQKYRRLKKCVLWCSLAVVVVGLMVGSLMVCFGESLLGLYAPENPDVVNAGMVRLSILCLTYFLCGLMEVGSGTMRGLGKSIWSTVISLFGACGLRIVWIYTVFAWFPTHEVLYLSYPVTWIITSIILYICSFAIIHKLRCSYEQSQASAATDAEPQIAETIS